MCATHYGRWRHGGDPTARGHLRGESLADRLMARVLVTDAGCWEYQGARTTNGYGSIGTGGRGKSGKAHRVAYALFRGPIPDGMNVCHHCDNPPCCNPEHLFLGDDAANAADRESKGRNRPAPAVEASARLKRSKTHCVHGHEFTDENTYWSAGKRSCRTCRAAASRRLYHRKK